MCTHAIRLPIHLWMDPGCFHVSVIVNSAVNTGMRGAHCIMSSPHRRPVAALLDPTVTVSSFLETAGTSILFSAGAAWIDTPSNSVGGLPTLPSRDRNNAVDQPHFRENGGHPPSFHPGHTTRTRLRQHKPLSSAQPSSHDRVLTVCLRLGP